MLSSISKPGEEIIYFKDLDTTWRQKSLGVPMSDKRPDSGEGYFIIICFIKVMVRFHSSVGRAVDF